MPKCFNFRFLNLFSSSHLCNRKFWSRDILSDLGHHQILKGQSFPQNRHSNSDHLSVQWVFNSLWLFANSMKSWLLKCCSDLELSWLMLLLIKRTWTYDYIVGQIHCDASVFRKIMRLVTVALPQILHFWLTKFLNRIQAFVKHRMFLLPSFCTQKATSQPT